VEIKEISELLNATILYQPVDSNPDILHVGASDMLSNVLAYMIKDILLVTALLSPQVIRTATLMDIPAVIFTGVELPDRIVEEAKKTNVTILSTPFSTFTTCGLLYEAGLRN
jgi:predicted transcriptional regulator